MICPLCTDVMVLGIMILVSQMLQCRIMILFTFISVICPLCTDVMVLDLMILVAQMLQCRIIIGLFSVLGWIVITHPIGVAGYISQYFCLLWDCSLLYCSCHIVIISAYYFKVLHRCYVASAVLVFMYGRWCF